MEASPQAPTGAPKMKERLESLTVNPIRLISGEVELPGSKSLSNRVLLLSALAEVSLPRSSFRSRLSARHCPLFHKLVSKSIGILRLSHACRIRHLTG